MDAILDQLRGGVLGAADLRQRLGVSPATLMRGLRQVGASVIRFGRGRATQYGLRQSWPLLDDSRFPLFRVDEGGTARPEGELFTLAARQTVWLPEGTVSSGLPLELADARPAGFLGRHFAALHTDLRLPDRLMDWSDHHILLAMSRRGEDVPGNLLVGDESFARWQALDTNGTTRDQYPALAAATMAGHPPGSSAGGERPKFGALVDGHHLLVKFAARGGDGDVVARRWCDLLLLEAHALGVVSAHGMVGATTRIVETPTHVFLESERFDRVGVRGRVAVLSLAAVHDDAADTWARAGAVLRQAGRISPDDARRLQWLDAFGALIANTDRHQFNINFLVDGPSLRLAPAFDQVSMLYSPAADGQLPLRPFVLPPATADTLEVWDAARSAAREFWQRASDDVRVSDDLRRTAASNAVTCSTNTRT